jgi:hypothetical protein
MNRKLLFWGISLSVLVLDMVGARGQSYEFAVVSNSVVSGINLSAVANNGNIFVCAGAANSPVLAVNTNNFASFAAGSSNGGYLLFSNAWTNTLKSPIKLNWLNCVAAQPSGFIASGASNAVFVSADGVNWTNWGRVLKPVNNTIAIDGIAYNPISSTFAAAQAFDNASWTTNPVSTNGWQGAGFQSPSFAESFTAVTPFASSNMVMCGILGDIRISTDGGEFWNVSQQVNSSLPNLQAVASDGGSNLVSAGNFSLIEVSTNGSQSATWTFQTNIIIGTSGGSTNFDAVAYSPAVNQFLAAGTIGANGLIVMAPEAASANWKWTRQTNVLTFQNGNLAPLTTSLSPLNGAAIANSGFFQGIALLVGNNGTIVVGGLPPPAPVNTANIDVTNVLTSPLSNAALAATVIGDTNHPVGILTVDWYGSPTGGAPVALNALAYQPTNENYGTYTNWAQERDLRTGFASASRTPFVFTIIPGAPANPVSTINCDDNNGQFGMCPTAPLSVTVVTNSANPPGTTRVNWYDAGMNLVASDTFVSGSDIATYTPSVSPGIYTYYAQATNPATGLSSASLTTLTFQLNPLPTWTSAVGLSTNMTLTDPQVFPTFTAPSIANLVQITGIEPAASITYDWYTSPDPTISTYENPAAPFAFNGIGGLPATNTASFVPTNALCGPYTYYVRARVVDPGFTGCACQSATLIPVTFTLFPPAPIDAAVNLTNVLGGAIQPIWVNLLTNADNPPANFVVNWNSAATGANNLNNSSDTNLSNRFFHTPTNAVCGVFTNWAETEAVITGVGGPIVSTNRIPVVFVIIPAAPTAVGTVDVTNCIEIPNPTFTVVVTNGQTANWYAVPSGGTPAAAGTLTFTPTNSSAGIWQYLVQAVDPITELSSTGAVLATLSLYDCTNSLAISLNSASGTGTIQWPGNLTLLSTTNLTPPVVWTSISTGSVFSAQGNTLTFTNANPPVEFFRLTN